MQISDIPKLTLDLLYPRRCPLCHDLAPVGKAICPECFAALPFVRDPRCRKCGKPVEESGTLCSDCAEYPRAFDEGRAALIYDDRMRESIRLFKNKGRKEYGSALGGLLFLTGGAALAKWGVELIVPVPLHRSKLRKRTYNQAEVLARELVRRTGLPMKAGALIRSEETRAMRQLGEAERRRNLEGAFSLARDGLTLPDGKRAERVLLVDDIFTTGSTIDACAAVLKRGGASQVFFLTVCIGAGAAALY